MLVQFAFKNFKSFKDEGVLDLSAQKITEHQFHIVPIGEERLLPAAGIYGANASGKSNTYQAFEYMHYYVTESFSFGGESADSPKDTRYRKPVPFLMDKESRESESSFEILFFDPRDEKNTLYNYGFCVNSDGVTEEWLNTKAKTSRRFRKVFHRFADSLELDGLPRKSRENIETSLEKEVLIVSLGAKLKIGKLKFIRDWFARNEFVDFGDPSESLVISRSFLKEFAENEQTRRRALDYVASFDDSIKNFNVEEVPLEQGASPDAKRYRIYTEHDSSVPGERVSLPLAQESGGTLKMFALFLAVRRVLEHGGVFFVDELNSRLHPLLVRNFILTFLNPELNPNRAQLIFTTHDTWHLSNNLLRRDEIWFTEKNAKGESTLYSLADFMDEEGAKIRHDEHYEKNYLLGKYGAIPSLRRMEMFGGETHEQK